MLSITDRASLIVRASFAKQYLRSRDRCISFCGKSGKLGVCSIGVKRLQRRKTHDVHFEWLLIYRWVCVADPDDLLHNAAVSPHDSRSLALIGFELRHTTGMNPKANHDLY